MNIARHGPLAAAILLAAAPVQAQEPTRDPGPARWETSHSIAIGDEPVHYNAVVSGITLTNDDGDPAAELWYTAYFRTNGAPSRARPLVFAFNGGPGSASFWLHMGIMGPRRVVTPEVGPQGAPPYPLEDNAYTILDIADIVMVDPIGTGFSHTLGDTPGSASTPASPAPRATSSARAPPTTRSPPRSARRTPPPSTATSATNSATTATASTSPAAARATGTGAVSAAAAPSCGAAAPPTSRPTWPPP